MRALPSLRRAIGVATASLLLLPAAAASAADVAASDAAATDAATSCDDLLVSFTRDATTGDDRAVAITAQAIEQGAPGWELIGWQSATGTQLTAVLATDRTGEVLHLGAEATGIAEQVTSLTFCGTTGGPSGADAEGADRDGEVLDDDGLDESGLAVDPGDDPGDDPADDTTEVDVEAPADTTERRQVASDSGAATTEDAEGTTAQEQATAEEGSSGEDASDQDTSGTEPASAPAATSTPAPTVQPGTLPDTTEATGTPEAGDSTDPDDEVEVLGVRIVATPDAEDDTDDAAAQDPGDAADQPTAQPALATAGLGTDRGLLDSAWLLAAAIAAGIAAGGTAIRYRWAAATNTSTDTITSSGQHGETHR